MTGVTDETLRALLDRAEIIPSPADVERIKRLYEQFLDRLKLLHAADLDSEEVAGHFSPGGEAQP